MRHIHIYIFLLASQATPLCSANSTESSNSLAPSRSGTHQAQKDTSYTFPQYQRGLINLGRSTAKDFSGEVLLTDALSYIAHHHFRHCSLVVAFDGTFAESLVLKAMIKLPHYKQVIEVQTPRDFSVTLWTSFQCRGYIFLFHDAHSILSFTDEADDPWDYKGKYVFAGLSKKELEAIIKTKKGRNTEHITGFVKEEDPDEWKMYMNQLYWGEGMTLVNRWRRRGFTSDGEIFPVKTWDLRGAPLTLYTFQFEPHVIFDAPGKRPHGRDIKMADTFAEVLNFTLVIKKSPDGEFWGFPDANGSWNGMNGKMQRREGHFGLGYSFLTNNDNRMAAIDFTQFYDCDQSCFMTRMEPPVPKWQSLLAPFKLDTWLGTLIGLLVISPIVYFLANGPATGVEEVKSLKLLQISYLYTFGYHIREPQVQIPKRTATKVWILFLSIHTLVLTTLYSGNLTAFLTVEKRQPSIETIQELHESGRSVIGIGCYFKVSFEESSNVYIKDFVNRYLRWTDQLDFSDQLIQGKGVFLETRTFQDYLIVTNYTYKGVTSMRIMKECYSPQNIGVTLQRHFPVKESFNKVIGMIYDTGLMLKWYMDILSQSKRISSDTRDNEMETGESQGGIPLSLEHLQGMFYILVFGLAISAIVFSLEVFWASGRSSHH